MSAAAASSLGSLDWVLALAPYRKDAAYLEMLLTQHKISVREYAGEANLRTQLDEAPGVIVATHEALSPAVLRTIADYLPTQPSWSELPIVILLDRAAPAAKISATLSSAWPRSRLIFYQRPVAALELVSGIQSTLLTRLRQRDVRDHLTQEIELRHELNHRVKNILASVASIFEMTRRGATTMDQLSQDFRGRLAALANVHSAVFQAGGEVVPIEQVVDITFTPYRGVGQDRIAAAGPPITISREAGTTLALCLHELATNAIKYGALAVPEGRVRFNWEVSSDRDPILTIKWAEAGGQRVIKPTRSGYGMRYLRGALANLFGETANISFCPTGLRCTVSGPLSRFV
jgi:two-component sensor histidine kinase